MSVLVQIVIKPQQQEDKDFILKIGLQKARLNPSDNYSHAKKILSNTGLGLIHDPYYI